MPRISNVFLFDPVNKTLGDFISKKQFALPEHRASFRPNFDKFP